MPGTQVSTISASARLIARLHSKIFDGVEQSITRFRRRESKVNIRPEKYHGELRFDMESTDYSLRQSTAFELTAMKTIKKILN